MELSTKYSPNAVEDKWFKHWMTKNYFHSEVDQSKKPFTIVIPPPNVTGVLHMGHTLNETVQDILVRHARMTGKNACWVPGTDHASIATEAKVVAMLKEKGIDKKNLSREEFLKYAFEWKEKYGGIIVEQLKKLGCSCDYDRLSFTMDDHYYKAVIKVFVDLYNKGLIYRGARMINWDPAALTALSDEEVIYKEVNSKLYYVKYKLEAPSNSPKGGEQPTLKANKYNSSYKSADPMLYGRLKEFVKEMRSNPTQAEDWLWQQLSGKNLEEYKFRRQHIIGTFITDFVCLKKRLIIEVDGLIHQLPDNKISDIERTEWLEAQGFKVIRFTNNEVLNDIENVLNIISSKLEKLKSIDEIEFEAAITPPLGEMEGAYITVATTRPETILGDVAICVNPTDERYTHLKGASAYVPLVNRKIPIIFDEYVDKEFGTGCLKITPAHDLADYNIGLKHNLPIIDTLNPNGTLSDAAQLYVGEDRFIARKKIAKDLADANLLEKEEDIKNKNGFSERTGSVVEPRISTQWFLKMDEMSKPTLNAQQSGAIKFHPNKFDNTFKYWMENIKDWCISRQLWWGQQIPAWYDDVSGKFVVAENEGLAKEIFNTQYSITNVQLRQDEDVLDTWFSSWLWPIEVFNGITNPKNEEIKYYYPTNVLVTGQDIIFFWVARMMMAGFEYEGVKPFHDVYFTGIVRDKQGRKMSKSLGNSPDLLELIEKYGADAVRFGIMVSSPAGNDLLFDETSCEQGRNFANKIWNALRLIKGWKVEESPQFMSPRNENEMVSEGTHLGNSEASQFAIEWMEQRINVVSSDYHKLIAEYKLSEALRALYSLIWDDFCAWYLEMIKPEFVDGVSKPIDKKTLDATINFFEQLMHLLHPFMPFCTEEFYAVVKERNESDVLVVKQFEFVEDKNINLIKSKLFDGELLKSFVTTIRDLRNKNQIKPKEPLNLIIEDKNNGISIQEIKPIIIKLANLSDIRFETAKPNNSISFVISNGNIKCHLETGSSIDSSLQKDDLQKELAHLEGFLKSVNAKLSNEKFVAHAKPEVLALEQKKKSDAESRMNAVKESLLGLN